MIGESCDNVGHGNINSNSKASVRSQDEPDDLADAKLGVDLRERLGFGSQSQFRQGGASNLLASSHTTSHDQTVAPHSVVPSSTFQ